METTTDCIGMAMATAGDRRARHLVTRGWRAGFTASACARMSSFVGGDVTTYGTNGSVVQGSRHVAKHASIGLEATPYGSRRTWTRSP